MVTAGPDGSRTWWPMGFRYNPATDTIDIGATDSRHARSTVICRNPKVAFVVDDLAFVDRSKPRGTDPGEADVLPTGGAEAGPTFDPEMFRVHPRWTVSWGLGGNAFTIDARSV